MDFETLRYELFPFIYGVGGIVAFLVRPDSALLKVSGVLLIVAALTVLRLRWIHRKALFERAPTASSIVRDAARDD